MGFDSFKNKVKILDASSLKSVIGGSGSCAFMTSDGYVFGGGVSREEAINYSRGGGALVLRQLP